MTSPGSGVSSGQCAGSVMESAVGGGVEMDGDAGIGSTGALHRSFTPLAIVGHSATNSGSVDDF